MSASRKKKERKAQLSMPISEATAQKGMDRHMNKGLKNALIIACVVIVVAFVIFSSMLSSGFFAKRTTAVTIDGHDLTPAMVNYYYREAYQQFSEYASYLGVDTSKSLSNQYVDEDKTQSWADYLLDAAMTTAASRYAAYDMAMSDGYTVTEADQKVIDESIDTLRLYAASNGVDSVDKYLPMVCGSGCDEESYREYIKVSTVSQNYLASFYNKEVTEAQVAEEYEANKNLYDGVSYRMIYVASDFFDEGTENVEEKVKELAESICAASTSEDAFVQACMDSIPESMEEEYSDPDSTLHTDASYSDVDASCAEWLFSEDRQSGDVTMIEDVYAYYVLYYIGRDTHDYLLPNVRHILIKVDDTTDTEAMTAAQAKAEFILDAFEATGKTEEEFADFAMDNSDDSNAEQGGLYENIYPNQMTANFSDWCFDESRQVGDTGIVETEYGYHVMYFCGYGMKYSDALVESAIRQAAYDAAIEQAKANDGYVLNSFGAKFITK